MSSSKQVAIVTGSNTGIGRETALLLAKDGMKVFMACRSADKGHEAASYIRESCPGADVEVVLLDLKTPDSVRRCASEFKSRNLPLNLLVNNAGVTLGTPWYTAEGVGGSAQVNYLGPYLFTRLLEHSLVAGAPSRVVNVSSIMHRGAKIPDPEKFLKDFDAGQYAQAKLANILFTFELQRRWQEKGVQACAVDPGAVFSDIWRRSTYNRPPLSWALKLSEWVQPVTTASRPHVPRYPIHWSWWEIRDQSVTSGIRSHMGWSNASTPCRYHNVKAWKGANTIPIVRQGGFAWWGVTKPIPTAIFGIGAAVFDWPIRCLSRGFLFKKVTEVPANPAAYDEKLASKLWSLSADIAGLSD